MQSGFDGMNPSWSAFGTALKAMFIICEKHASPPGLLRCERDKDLAVTGANIAVNG